MPLDDPRFLAVAAAVIAIAALIVGMFLSRFLRGHRSRGRNARALSGERDAERLLERAGYRIVARQQTASWSFLVDGVAVPVEVRADLVVTRGKRRLVAEVKTGAHAPDPRTPATRRQLLEYSIVFGCEEVLLVDVEAGEVHAISFGG